MKEVEWGGGWWSRQEWEVDLVHTERVPDKNYKRMPYPEKTPNGKLQPMLHTHIVFFKPLAAQHKWMVFYVF